MSDEPWYRSFFGTDYLAAYESSLPPARTALEVERIVALLGLERGARILDVACGHGRHAIPLAQRGFRVTGYDLSEVFLDKAKRDAMTVGADVSWHRGDMRELPFNGEFDAAINIFTAFGYFASPDDDLAVLRAVRRALVPGGRFLLETLHRDGLAERFQRTGFERLPNGTLVLRERDWDLARDIIDEKIELLRPDGSRTVYHTAVRLYSLNKFLTLLDRAGLESERWYGGLDGSALQLHSRRLVVISRRPTE